MKSIINDTFSKRNLDIFEISFGYDCVEVIIHNDETDSLFLCELKDKIGSKYPILVRITDDNMLAIIFDISHIILKYFKDWNSYEEYYSF